MYTIFVKNITLSGDETIIRRAREKAQRENTTLNALFRKWLGRYVGRDRAHEEYRSLMSRLSYSRAGHRFSRDELNER